MSKTHFFRTINIVDVASDLKNGIFDNKRMLPISTSRKSTIRPSTENAMTKSSRQACINNYPGFNDGVIHHRVCARDENGDPIYGPCKETSGVMRCMYCFRSFCSEEMVGIPVAKTSKGIYLVEDAFCDIRCALAEIKIRLHRTDLRMNYGNSIKLLDEMCSRSGLDLSTIKPAPCQRLLAFLNGPLTHEQFSEGLYYVLSKNVPKLSVTTDYDYFMHN